jgi:hypothetical protein
MRGGGTGPGEVRGALTESHVEPSAKLGRSRLGTKSDPAQGQKLAPDRGLSPRWCG